jgi:hypothetical protein
MSQEVLKKNVINKILNLFKLKYPKGIAFIFIHCWYFLCTLPRWETLSHKRDVRTPTKVQVDEETTSALSTLLAIKAKGGKSSNPTTHTLVVGTSNLVINRQRK